MFHPVNLHNKAIINVDKANTDKKVGAKIGANALAAGAGLTAAVYETGKLLLSGVVLTPVKYVVFGSIRACKKDAFDSIYKALPGITDLKETAIKILKYVLSILTSIGGMFVVFDASEKNYEFQVKLGFARDWENNKQASTDLKEFAKLVLAERDRVAKENLEAFTYLEQFTKVALAQDFGAEREKDAKENLKAFTYLETFALIEEVKNRSLKEETERKVSEGMGFFSHTVEYDLASPKKQRQMRQEIRAREDIEHFEKSRREANMEKATPKQEPIETLRKESPAPSPRKKPQLTKEEMEAHRFANVEKQKKEAEQRKAEFVARKEEEKLHQREQAEANHKAREERRRTAQAERDAKIQAAAPQPSTAPASSFSLWKLFSY